MAENRQSRTARRKQKKSKKKPVWKKIFLGLLIFFLVIGVAVAGLFTYYIATAPEIDASQLSDPVSSKVYDPNGELIADLGEIKRTKIEYDDLPDILIDAVTATEDARFFEHPGIDIRRIGGAVIGNLRNGFGSEGASTITQQVVERSFLNPEKKLSLKVQEQWLALKLEQDYSKEQILEMYLNKIFYGANAYGVAKAAETYFGKTDLHELTLPEAAILAGLPQRPTAYNPFNNPDLTKERMETVLKLMVRHDKITQEEADEALKVDITSLLVKDQPEPSPYDAFIQQVEKEVNEKLDGADIYSDGLKIYTTIDKNAQDHVEYLLSNAEDNPIPYPNEDLHAGLVVLDTKTGAIRAIGGDRNYQNGFNYAIQGGNQAGSTFKPIVAYGPAIEYNKMSTYHQINDDKPYEIAGTDGKVIRNWNREYQGWMTARYALQESLNVPAVKTLEETGYDNAQKFANNLGIEFANGRPQLTDAIGGADTTVNPLQMAGAYQAFGNGGIRYEPHAVTKVVFPDERTVDLAPEPVVAMSDYTAYMISDMLKTALSQGSSGGNARMPGLPVAAKTGTTNLEDQDGAKDSWVTGFTTNYTMSVWVGYDETNRTMPYADTQIAHYLFKNTMTELSKDIETADFTKPDSVVKVAVEKGSNPATLPSDYTPESEVVTELFVKGTEPTKTSEKYDKLDAVKDLKAEYVAESNAIKVQWGYDKDKDQAISFEVSASVDDGKMQVLSTTEDNEIEITEVTPGSSYTIQVVAFNAEDDSKRSDPQAVSLTLEAEEEPDTINPVENLSANFIPDQSLIDVSWDYNGPPASFEVIVEGPQGGTQIVQSKGIEINGNFEPGGSYTIHVTAIGQNGGQSGNRSETRTTTIDIPSDSEDTTTEPEEPANEEDGEE
ncbi:penicillin-binding protein 1A [Ornithinibacillus contaminans]|uniref:penicillin-binding protein 1A n=1 Tax=Ornithinibacillus contaminans TaxID=694055 RepID=UPI00064D8599|nr:penicillin-binding protein 1A [Ornithinibacillus contaminans]